MYERVLNNKNAWHLLYKVFFEVGLHFARRGREGLRELTKDSIMIKRDSYGVECVIPARVEVENPKQGEEKTSRRKWRQCTANLEMPDVQ